MIRTKTKHLVVPNFENYISSVPATDKQMRSRVMNKQTQIPCIHKSNSKIYWNLMISYFTWCLLNKTKDFDFSKMYIISMSANHPFQNQVFKCQKHIKFTMQATDTQASLPPTCSPDSFSTLWASSLGHAASGLGAGIEKQMLWKFYGYIIR